MAIDGRLETPAIRFGGCPVSLDDIAQQSKSASVIASPRTPVLEHPSFRLPYRRSVTAALRGVCVFIQRHRGVRTEGIRLSIEGFVLIQKNSGVCRPLERRRWYSNFADPLADTAASRGGLDPILHSVSLREARSYSGTVGCFLEHPPTNLPRETHSYSGTPESPDGLYSGIVGCRSRFSERDTTKPRELQRQSGSERLQTTPPDSRSS